MKTVKIELDDEVLSGLVREQLSSLTGLNLSGELPQVVVSRVKTSANVPHLLLGGKAEENCEILPLPLRLGDLTDRLRYMLSGRNKFANMEVIEFLNYSLNAEDGVMTDLSTNEQIRLTDKEKLLIQSLYAEENKSLDRAGLLQKVWSYAETAETHTLETHLYRLRQKLEDGFGLKDLIVTKDGIYTLKI